METHKCTDLKNKQVYHLGKETYGIKAHLAMDVTVRTDPENILMLEAKRNGSSRKVMTCLREHSYLMAGSAPRESMFCLFPP